MRMTTSRTTERIWTAVIGFGPLAVFILYWWNPGNSANLIFTSSLIVLSIATLFRNPFQRTTWKSALVSIIYVLFGAISAVRWLYTHLFVEAVWAVTFLLFAMVWAYRYWKGTTNHRLTQTDIQI